MSRLIHIFAALLLTLGFVTDAAAQASRRTAGRPVAAKPAAKKKGLLILLENGGVKANLPSAKGEPSHVKLPMASCGKLHFALNPGETTARMVTRLRGVIADNRQCVNPRAWRVRQVDFATFTRLNSDVVIEEVAKALSLAQNPRGVYDRIVVLEDAQMTPARALTELRRMAAGHVVDVHVLAHGGDGFFVGGKPSARKPAATFGSSFFEDVQAIPGLQLGAVYQMNCVSGTLMDDWRRVGARVVNGTVKKKNNYMPQQYYHFMRHWLGGAQFGYAIRESYKESRLYSLPAYQAFGHASYVSDSRHVVSGAANLAATPTKNTGYVLAETSAKTVWALAEDLHNQGKTVAQMITALLAAGHNLRDTARAVVRASRCNTYQLIAGLLQVGRTDLNEIATVAQAALGGQLDEGQLCKAMLEARRSPTEVARLLASHFNRSRLQVARLLHARNLTARQVARALTDGMAATTEQVADTLKTLGHSTRTIALALKLELRRGHRATAIALQKAGCKMTEIVKVLRDDFKCSLATIAKDLRAAGSTLQATAQAMWNAGSHTVADLNTLGQALAGAYAQTVAQVMGTLAAIGITA